MVHISQWAATAGLFKGCAKLLPAGAPLIIYGPFLEADVETAPTNRAFDRSLKARNPEWGLRDVAELDRVGAEIGRAACRERVCQYVEILVVAVSLKKKHMIESAMDGAEIVRCTVT